MNPEPFDPIACALKTAADAVHAYANAQGIDAEHSHVLTILAAHEARQAVKIARAMTLARIAAEDRPHIYDSETPAFRAFLRDIDTMPEATLRRAVKFVLDDLYGAGDGDADSPRYLNPDKEWTGDTANEVRESLYAADADALVFALRAKEQGARPRR